MSACATVLVKDGKTEKVVNLSDYEADQAGEKKFTLVESPTVTGVSFDPTRVSASSGDHARIAAARGYAEANASTVATVGAPATEDGEDDSDVLETVLNDEFAPKDLTGGKTAEEFQAEIDTAQAEVDAVTKPKGKK